MAMTGRRTVRVRVAIGWVAMLAPLAAAGEAPVFFGIRPGTTTKAEVDLSLGEPVSRSAPASRFSFPYPNVCEAAAEVAEYLAPPEAAEARNSAPTDFANANA